MNADELACARWRLIMPFGYIGQESLITATELLRALNHGPMFSSCWDIACGRGAFSIAIASYFADTTVLGTDVDAGNIAAAAAAASAEASWLSGRASFRVEAIKEEMTTPQRLFDCIVSVDALQHGQDPTIAVVNAISAWNGSGPLFLSLWCCEDTMLGREVAMAWSFPTTLPKMAVCAAVSAVAPRLVVSDNSNRFVAILHRSLTSLLNYRHEFASLFGSEAFDARRQLEEVTLQAALAGDLTQCRIRRAQ